MTAPDTHTERPQPVPPALVELRAVRSLLKACAPGWHWTFTRARGPLDVGGLSVDTDSDGKRHRVTRVETVESIVGRGRHHGPPARAVVALWIHRDGWSLDAAWRGRHDGEDTPMELSATELGAYVAAGAAPADELLELDLGLEAAA